LIGLFLNTLVLRVDLTGDPSVRTLLDRVRGEVLEAQGHSELPFERLVEELRPERNRSYNPLFQVLVVQQNTPAPKFLVPGLAIKAEILDLATAQLDLSFSFRKSGDILFCGLEYSSDLFAVPTIERLLGHYSNLLAGFAATPGAKIGDLPLLSPGERHQLLAEWNDSTGPGWGVPLPRLLAARAAASSGAPAVIGGGTVLTYFELYARAARLAGRLCDLGVGPGSRVALCLERSPELIVALLATLGAGGAYVTLDPAYPEERLAFLLADSGATVLVTRREIASRANIANITNIAGLADRLPTSGPAVLFLDGEEDLQAGEEEAFPTVSGLEDLLYVIYTSGSTGVPKGAGIYQGSFVHLLGWYTSEFGLSAADRFLVITPPGFDLTQKNFFAPLLCGGLLALADPGLYEPREIVATIERHGITRLNCTPSAFYPLIEEAGIEGLSSLRSVFLGGEPISRARLTSWRHAGGVQAEVVNTYGPTECTDVVAFHRLSPEAAGATPVPVGRPLPGFHLQVLDPYLGQVPIGAPGQLAVSGVGVGAGYLGRAELTAEKFVPDPFAMSSMSPGSRLYLTGDLARTRPDGEIEFLGRVDHQVKLRGLRIELGEIETSLRQHPGVREAVVLAREDRPGDRRLAAYWTAVAAPGPTPAPTPEELHAFLAERLPLYMVPADWVRLAELPLSIHGKVDRRALPAPERGGIEEQGFVAPRTPVENLLAEIWSELLGLDRVGAFDSFFKLGGHSLLATQLVSRIHTALEVELPLRSLFEAPTLAEMALAVEELVIARLDDLSEEELGSLG
jgi:amino acid adenylation domain-containing protein